jgi:hypothetical protein
MTHDRRNVGGLTMIRFVQQLLIAFTLFNAFQSQLAIAESFNLSDKIIQNIKDVCLKPSDKGKYWDIGLKAGGETNLKLKFLGKASAEASFNKGEWDGIQKVLPSQQAADNASYRDCVNKLTPLFLNKFVPNNSSAKITKSRNKKKEQRLNNKQHLTKQNEQNIILRPDQERLLELLYKYQKQFSASKLVISRTDGTLYFDNDPKRGSDVNLIKELYGKVDASDVKHFEVLMESMPYQYTRVIPETRLDSPFVVNVTDDGIKYLRTNIGGPG